MDELKPDTKSQAVRRQEPDTLVCKHVYGGTRVIRENHATYLPSFPLEDPTGYLTRVKTSVLFNAYRITVDGLVGMVTRQDPELGEDAPKELQAAWENIDNAGRHGSVFAADLLTDAVKEGHACIFVDMPAEDPNVRTRADEIAKGRRPYFALIRKSDILRASSKIIDGRHVLVSFAYRECVSVPDGDFGDRDEERVRDYRLDGGVVSFRIYAKRKDGKGAEPWVEDSQGVLRGIDRIPVATVYGRRTGFMESEPPLLDLAYQNIHHLQISSDHDNTLHICGVPLFFGKKLGIPDNSTLKVGSQTGINASEADADAKYVEPSGAALASTQAAIDKDETRMATLGLAMLKPEFRATETATGKQLDQSQKDSALAKIARSLQDCLEEASGYFAKWLRIEDGGSVVVSKNFSGLTMSVEVYRAMGESVSKGHLSLETMWAMAKAGKLLPEDFDAEAELVRIEAGDMKVAAMFPFAPKAPPAKPDPVVPVVEPGATDDEEAA